MATHRDAIITALKESKYRWRTAEGLSKDTGIPVKTVREFLESSSEITRAKKTNKTGQALYATREKRPATGGAQGSSSALTTPHKPLKCLVLLPFEPSIEPLRRAIDFVLLQHAIEPLSFEERIATGALWVDGVMSSLRACDFLIADVTRRNPNVLFELGMAHGIGKPFVLLVSAHSDGDIPSDLSGYQYIAYDTAATKQFQLRLDRFVRHMASRLGSAV